MSDVLIKNVCAIEHLEVPIEAGKVTVITGRNGAGKSTAMEAVMTVAASSTAGIELSPRDGNSSGSIVSDGVTIRVGKRIGVRGKQETFAILESGEDLEKFVDPGVKDPVSADLRRMESLLTMAGVKIGASQVRGWIGEELAQQFLRDHPKAVDLAAASLVDTLRRWLHKQAGEKEKQSAQIEGQLAQLGEIPVEPEGSVDPVAEADAAESAARQAWESLVASRTKCQSVIEANAETARQLQTLEETIEKLSPTLEDPLAIAVELETLDEQLLIPSDRLRVIDAQLDQKRAQIRSLEAECETLNATRAEVVDLRSKLNSQRAGIERRIENAKNAQKGFAGLVADTERLRATVKTGLEDELRQLEIDVNAAKQKHSECQDRATEARKIRKAREQQRELLRMQDDFEKRAEKLRSHATTVVSLLRDAVKTLEGWSVDDDLRLCCSHERGPAIHFSDLSPGEQAIRAIWIGMAMRKRPDGVIPVVAIPQPIWESLDDTNRKMVVDFAKDKQVAIVTAEAAHGNVPRELQAKLVD